MPPNWEDYKAILLDKLNKIDDKCDDMRHELKADIKEMRDAVSELKVNFAHLTGKAIGFGAILGLIGFVVALSVEMIF